jgi:hypothetical protein
MKSTKSPLSNFVAYFLVALTIVTGVSFGGSHYKSVTSRSASDVDAGADSGPLVRSGFSDGTNWQLQTVGRIQNAGIGAPGVSNDSTQGYSIGSLWFNSSNGTDWYICTSNAVGAAQWNIFTGRVNQASVNSSVQPLLAYADFMSDSVASGLLGTVPGSGLTMTIPSGVAYVTGLRVVATGGSYTYTASKDTYDYLQTNGAINHVPVTNGASAPVGQTGLAIEKVVTSSSAITSVTQLASTAPVFNVGNAVASTNNALSISQADSRYVAASTISGSFGANLAMMSPNGTSGALSPRSIQSADLPMIALAKGGLGASTSATFEGVLYGNGSGAYIQTPTPASGLMFLRSNAANSGLEWAASAGISSIALTDSSGIYNWSPNPLTINGTITGSLATQTARTVLAAPPGLGASAAAPSFRNLGRFDTFGDLSNLRPLPTFSTPGAPGTITHGGTAGSSTYTYCYTAVMADGVTSSPAGSTTSTATGNATLSGTNTNIIPLPTVTGASKYNVYRTAGGATQGYIGQTSGTSFTDTGITASSPGWNLPLTAPTTYVLIGEYYNSANWTQPGAITSYRFRGYCGGTVTINGVWTIAPEIPGGAAGPLSGNGNVIVGSNGGGLAPGLSYYGTGEGGGGSGGGHGGAGGNGGSQGGNYAQPSPVLTYPLETSLCGSSGGGGTGISSCAGGNGGAGGGSWYLESIGSISFTSSAAMTAAGGAGQAITVNTICGAGGGGSGGGIMARSLGTVTISSGATITAPGGAGGAAFVSGSSDCAGGGGGGGGIDFSGTSVTNSGTNNITAPGGAAGGNNGTTQAATAGSPGYVNLNQFVQGPRSAA